MQRGFAERTAINAPIQGTAADVIKLAMVHIQDWLKGSKFQAKMILQVHDELIFDVPREELEEVRTGVVRLMEAAHPMPVPLLVEAGVGEDWLEAH
jgi:DNA polymerase-1